MRVSWDDAVVKHALGEERQDKIRELREDLDIDPYVRGAELPDELS